ncbi:sodium:calcium antiporter [Anabaenopsis tanganyikae CS-531]|uniref:Sodium:calcium antiporter n=1 Tax=Anabaenopsis tanganyikae CS-531 TaxID=2785304 RepID=A0ABT6K9I1_9CYAN|nr:sodium:calcium antiporter [Anabaenopsis tanganyikae]MDH6104520.1 sodium:calcium antiporter [Anabaenopsis tanganyikae CS-531]
MFLFIQVLVCVLLVIAVGMRLSQSADVVAEKTGLGRTWVGGLLLAGVTSLPELATGVSAVTVLDAPDLAVGGILGSCLFNLMVLGILDLVSGREPLLKRAPVGLGLSASLGCAMLGLTAAGMLLTKKGIHLAFGWVGIPSLLLILLYVVSARIMTQFEIRRMAAAILEVEPEAAQYQHIKRGRAYLNFTLLALATVLLGVWLAYLGDEIATTTGLGQSFIGSLLLAAATSLPEVVVSLEAIRMNAVEMAVSNIFGSNLWNLAILGIYDVAYLKGDLWLQISDVHLFTAIISMIMTSVAIVGLIYHAVSRSRMYVTWDGLTLIALYIGGMYIIYRN